MRPGKGNVNVCLRLTVPSVDRRLANLQAVADGRVGGTVCAVYDV
jgi:hypothetical protein